MNALSPPEFQSHILPCAEVPGTCTSSLFSRVSSWGRSWDQELDSARESPHVPSAGVSFSKGVSSNNYVPLLGLWGAKINTAWAAALRVDSACRWVGEQ